MSAIYLTLTGPRTFSVGAGAPNANARIVTEVSMPPIRSDARIGSEPDSFDLDIALIPGLPDLFWPPPIGATISIYKARDGALIVAGTLIAISINTASLQLTVQL